MSKPTQIMVVMDSALEMSPAVLRGQALARKSEAVLLLRSFEYERRVEQASKQGFDLAAYLQARHARLEQVAQRLRETGVKVETQVVWGHPMAEQILFEVLAVKPALVIKSASQAYAFSRAFLSGLDWRLLSQCPAPLMLVHPGSPSVPKKILAALDPLDEHGKPHELNADILREAISLSMQCNADLDVVNAFEYIPFGGEAEYAGWRPDLVMYEELRKVHAEGLYKLGRQYSIPPGKMHILNGEASRAITGFAAQVHADLVVMGSVYRSGLKHLFLGSTAEGVFDRLGCDLLVLKPAGFAAELAGLLEPAKSRAA
ncbi:MAG: universal stress protein [Bacillota bacterium]